MLPDTSIFGSFDPFVTGAPPVRAEKRHFEKTVGAKYTDRQIATADSLIQLMALNKSVDLLIIDFFFLFVPQINENLMQNVGISLSKTF